MMSGLAAREATPALPGMLPGAAVAAGLAADGQATGQGGNPFGAILSGMLPGEAAPAAVQGLPATASPAISGEAVLTDATAAAAPSAGELATALSATPDAAALTVPATPVPATLAGLLTTTATTGNDLVTEAAGDDAETGLAGDDDPLTRIADAASSSMLTLPGQAALTPSLTHAAPLQLAGHPAVAALAQAVARAGVHGAGGPGAPSATDDAAPDIAVPDGLLKASLQQAQQAQQHSAALAAHGAGGAASGTGLAQAASVASLNAAPAWLSVLRDAMSSGQPTAASALDGLVAGEGGGSSGLTGEFSLRLAQPALSREVPVFTLAPNAQQDASAWTTAFNQRLVLMAQQGVQQASLTMNPVDLGPIEVHLSMADDVARVHFTAQQAATQDLIESALPRLAHAFEAQGLRLDDARVSAQPLRPENGFLAQSSGQQMNQGQHSAAQAGNQGHGGGQGGEGSAQNAPGQTGLQTGREGLVMDTTASPRPASGSAADGAVDYYA